MIVIRSTLILCLLTCAVGSRADVQLFDEYSMNAYELDASRTSDFLIGLLNSGHLANPNAKIPLSVVFVFKFAELDEGDDCRHLRDKVDEQYSDEFDNLLNSYSIPCDGGTLTYQEAKDRLGDLLQIPVDSPVKVDAHWAWYVATGKDEPLRNLLDSYLYAEEACRECIAWSYPSMFSTDSGVNRFFGSYYNDKNEIDRAKLIMMFPDGRIDDLE